MHAGSMFDELADGRGGRGEQPTAIPPAGSNAGARGCIDEAGTRSNPCIEGQSS